MKVYNNKITALLDVQTEKLQNRVSVAPKQKTRKKNARIVCPDRNEYWTTQKQFWQWVREGVVAKTGDQPLTGKFLDQDADTNIVLANTILNLKRPNHLREVMDQRKLKK